MFFMINILVKLDRTLFSLINNLPHPFFLDTFFYFLSFVGYFGAIWIVIIFFLTILKEVKNNKGLSAVILAGFLSLVVIEWIMKQIFRRLRPEFRFPNARVLESQLTKYLTESFSFPSGHATMSFAAAFILAKVHRKFAFIYYLLAILISFSRIYLGKHYPSDVIVGIFIGLAIGYFSLKAVGV